jgi:transcriptional regulator with GAF, ATPase, and Fis domain
MSTKVSKEIAELKDKIFSFGKENLQEILYFMAEGVERITGCSRCRIYLEDLTEGLLICAYARGERHADMLDTSYFINPKTSLISKAFIDKKIFVEDSLEDFTRELDERFAKRFGIKSMAVLPMISDHKALGVICLDSFLEGPLASRQQLNTLNEFIQDLAGSINEARKYHQKVIFSKQLDQARKREAAFLMLRSAVKLVDKLTLASVLVPHEEEQKILSVPAKLSGDKNHLDVLAIYAREPRHKNIYEDMGKISVVKGESLMSQILELDPRLGITLGESYQHPLYFPDVKKEVFQKKEIAQNIGLTSLYVVPRYDLFTRKLICAVNYYTQERYEFGPFEKALLESHAEMVERVIKEIGEEHIEIRVLSEIESLLTEKNENLQVFLSQILSKASELIGADTGTIGLIQDLGGEKWLMVETEDGRLIGAKAREWRKRYIPPIKIGGEELSPSERSLTGLVAFEKKPQLVKSTREVKERGGFYMEISPEVCSELAVPVLLEDETIAVINLDSFGENYFTEEHTRILQIIARLVSRHIFDLMRIQELQQEVLRLKRDIDYRDPTISSYALGNIIGKSKKTQEMVNMINTVVPPLFNRINHWDSHLEQEATIGLPSLLITGETGSGKEFVFNHIYSLLNEMYKKARPGVGELAVKKSNIAAYSGELTYSELFGHKKGSYTGAYTDRKGILEEAHGGLVFLDEIGDADPKTQVQLLRFLDNGSFLRLGENKTCYARVFLVAATNRDLKTLIREGRFREDLYHRLSELSLEIPSLNQRREDIPDLATHFLGKLYLTYKGKGDDEKNAPYLTAEAKAVLSKHHYQGNVRELRSILLRSLFSRSQRKIDKDDILTAVQAVSQEGMKAEMRPALEKLEEQAAENILQQMVVNNQSFWKVVYEPFSRNEITKDLVKRVITLARSRGAQTMPQLARLFKVCNVSALDIPEENKKFLSFKNFLYKTVKISQ